MPTPEEYQNRLQKLEDELSELQGKIEFHQSEIRDDMTRISQTTLKAVQENANQTSQLKTAVEENTRHIDRLKTDIQNIPHFDWKWFLGIIIPIIFVIMGAGLKVNGDLKVHQIEIKHLQSSVARVETGLEKTNLRIDSIGKQLQAFEVTLTEIKGGIQLINQKLGTQEAPK